MKTIDTILFDFDSTLVDTGELIVESWQHTFRTFEGKERPRAEILRTIGEPLSVTMAKTLPQVPLEESLVVYREYHKEHFTGEIMCFPGIPEMLARLKEERYSLALVTSRLRGTTMLGIEKYGLRDYFDAIITCDDTERHKPDPDPIFAALEIIKKKPEEAVMVGDTAFDIICAKNAGVKSVLATWGRADRGRLEGTDGNALIPDYVINKPEDLYGVLAEASG
jgi:pyrophosphatase PpaX